MIARGKILVIVLFKGPKLSMSGSVRCAAADGFFLIVTWHSLATSQFLSWISFISHQQYVSSYFLSLSNRTSLITITLQRCVLKFSRLIRLKLKHCCGCVNHAYFRQILLLINGVIVGSESGFLSFVKGLGDYEHMFCIVLLSMRTYALYDRSKRIMWFMIICATILSGVSCVGHVLDSVCRVLRERSSSGLLFGTSNVTRCIPSLPSATMLYRQMCKSTWSDLFQISYSNVNLQRNSYVFHVLSSFE